jgi:hypothetical protein
LSWLLRALLYMLLLLLLHLLLWLLLIMLVHVLVFTHRTPWSGMRSSSMSSTTTNPQVGVVT